MYISSYVNNLKVAVRVRDLNDYEIVVGSSKQFATNVSSWKAIKHEHSIIQTTYDGVPLPAKAGRTIFNYTRTFDGISSNGQIYDAVCEKTVDSFSKGVNGIIIAYGQTGSGKTFTMEGGESGMDGRIDEGIIEMTAADIFKNIEDCPDRTYIVQVSMFEMHDKEIRDLLVNQNISSRLDPKTKQLVDTCKRTVTDYIEFMELISLGNERRKVRKTDMNYESSRSHRIVSITLESRTERYLSKEQNNAKTFKSTLYLVDLAGSSSSLRSESRAQGSQQMEANQINKR